MDKERRCANSCVFCFIDQLPKGLRETLYFKDDDARLSFLLGNYITLTNLSETEINRIIDLRISR
jgi:NifB/MoaA-like Fe-S oxidoreductase